MSTVVILRNPQGGEKKAALDHLVVMRLFVNVPESVEPVDSITKSCTAYFDLIEKPFLWDL